MLKIDKYSKICLYNTLLLLNLIDTLKTKDGREYCLIPKNKQSKNQSFEVKKEFLVVTIDSKKSKYQITIFKITFAKPRTSIITLIDL